MKVPLRPLQALQQARGRLLPPFFTENRKLKTENPYHARFDN